MNKYNGLLNGIASQYCIEKGERETPSAWKVRLIYSICAMMAYASLWDHIEEETVSIVHVKKGSAEYLIIIAACILRFLPFFLPHPKKSRTKSQIC